MAFSPFIRLFAMALLLGSAVGCRSGKTAPPPATVADLSRQGLSEATEFAPVHALTTPPIGWKAEPLKSSDRHAHQVWLSPTGHTAYGVIYFPLPLPLWDGLVLSEFIRQMRKSEGNATLLSKTNDDEIDGIRFVAEGGLYKMRANLLVRGSRAWAVYAGTLRDKPELPEELILAEQAREQTRIIQP